MGLFVPQCGSRTLQNLMHARTFDYFFFFTKTKMEPVEPPSIALLMLMMVWMVVSSARPPRESRLPQRLSIPPLRLESLSTLSFLLHV